MKSQCDTHGCNELLCGCSTSCLESLEVCSNPDLVEAVKAKDKWIDKLLDQVEQLETILSRGALIDVIDPSRSENVRYISVLDSVHEEYLKNKKEGKWDV